jgi:hypothetical protein
MRLVGPFLLHSERVEGGEKYLVLGLVWGCLNALLGFFFSCSEYMICFGWLLWVIELAQWAV